MVTKDPEVTPSHPIFSDVLKNVLRVLHFDIILRPGDTRHEFGALMNFKLIFGVVIASREEKIVFGVFRTQKEHR